MRILVTGGAGFIGSAVVQRLVGAGHHVDVLDDLSSGKREHLPASVRLVQADIRDAQEVVGELRPEVVCHLAAQVSVAVSVSDPVLDAEVNVIGLLRVLGACVATGVRKVVFASSGGTIYGPQERLPVPETAVGRPSSPYGITKRAGEDYLRFFRDHHGLDFTSLALANVYGPRQDPHGEAGVVAIFAHRLLRGEPPVIFGSGEFTRDYVYVEDVAEAFELALERGSGETFNVGTGVETSVNELFKLMAAEAGFGGDPVYAPPRAGDVPRSALDPSKAAAGLGWRPRTPLRDGIRRTLAWFREHG